MNSVNKAIIPAAGLGKRMHPLSSYLPKPMLPLGKEPVLQYIVEEITAAGIQEILIVTRSDHQAVFDYFEGQSNITFKIDDSAGGPGKAILEGSDFIRDDPFLIVFADAPLGGSHREQVIGEMIEVFKKKSPDSLLSIYPVTKKEASYRGIVQAEDQHETVRQFKITNISEKPAEIRTSNPWATACRYIFDSDIFDALKAAEPDEEGELQLTAGINKLLEEDREVIGIPLPEGVKRYDTGNFEGYFKAFTRFTNAGN